MKRFFYLFVCTLLCGCLFAGNLTIQNSDFLEGVLVPKDKTLDIESLAAGLPIYACNVNISKKESFQSDVTSHCIHVGNYIGGYIETRIYDLTKDRYGHLKELSPTGIQRVRDSSTQTISETLIWEVETIRGQTYIVHYHANFRVYSSADTQFVIAD